MRNQTVVVAATVVVVAVVAGAAAVVVAFGRTHQAVAANAPGSLPTPMTLATTPAQPTPTPTVTVTKRKVVRETVEAPAPRYRGGDSEFLSMIARDGIRAPDDWAIEAGRETCGTGYSYSYDYLTDGGIYGYHVQTFIDDWISAHGGC
ncbi:hypothetical protein J4573_08280 [Actinomadura barringtoniae]|uniref:Uncharacterized protein n=1 Tax=Actinomadura barringtoniae TaxID=1427535 RepID=A0A939T2S9_9ACTN|nr:hypothetical protein [Actinomadura barringtoniae]MBO2447083.1 hypothetical protein [Actinomadura barringtoniae]